MNESLRARLTQVEERIAAACARSGRARSDVTLVAVTKSVEPELAARLPPLGIVDLGENRPQELWRKAPALSVSTRWHLIGHLQRNKIERTLPLVHLIHSVDSARLLEALDKEAGRQQRTLRVLLEVNVSGEASKHGFTTTEAEGLAAIVSRLEHVTIDGLMTMAAFQDPEACRPTFRALRMLRDRLREQVPKKHAMTHLSMGMSNDFEIAIEEGATFVRLGTLLWEGMQ